MGKVNLIKEEVLEVKYIHDETFEDGVRRDEYRKQVQLKNFMYGTVHFINGLKLRVDERYNKIKIKHKYLKSGKKYKVTYKLTWEGKTKFHNGEIIELIDLDCIKPSDEISKKYSIEIPDIVKLYLNDNIGYYNEKSLKDMQNTLLNIRKSKYNSEEQIWIANNLFKLELENIKNLSLQIYRYIEKFSNGYDGVLIMKISEDKNFSSVSSEKILDAIDYLYKECMICYTLDKESIYPFWYTD